MGCINKDDNLQQMFAEIDSMVYDQQLHDLGIPTDLPDGGIKNYNVAVREYGDQIVFLRQIVPGAASKSYGIHVAKLAGLPGSVVDRAGVILEKLEDGSKKEERELL